jgi:hypothetical protein
MSGNDVPLVLATSWLSYRSTIGPIGGKPVKFRTDADYEAFIFGKLDEIRKDAGRRRIVLMGDVPGSGDAEGISDCILRPTTAQKHCLEATEVDPSSLKIFAFNQAMKAYAIKNQIEYIDPFDALCHDNKCLSLIQGQIMYSDAGHLSKDGSTLVMRHFANAILETDNGAEKSVYQPSAPPVLDGRQHRAPAEAVDN